MDPRHLARLKEQLRPVAEHLDLRGAGIEAFREHLERVRQRPVYLQPCSLGRGILGLWAATDTADVIFYEEATTPYHQRHIVFHEGSHMLQGHVGPTLPDLLSTAAPHLDPKLIRSLLCRSIFNTQQEAEAEMLATLIEERLEQAPIPSIVSTNPNTTRDVAQFFLRNR